MEEKYFIRLLFTVVLSLTVHSEDNITESIVFSNSTYIEESNSTDYVNTTETDELINGTEPFSETTSYETSTTKRPITLPRLPEAFQAVIRLSRSSYPASAFNVIVSYDLKRNRAAVTKEESKRKTRRIYDFKLNRILNINGSSCLAENIAENATEDLTFPFPFALINEEKQMKDPLSVFRLDGNDTEMSEEEIFVNGVPCTEYFKSVDMGYVDTCKQNVQCNIRQFFSNSEWKNPNCKDVHCDPMPIRISVECGYGPLQCYYLRLVFSFLDFCDRINDEEEFQQPPGVYCDYASAESFPSLSSSVQVTLLEKDTLSNTERSRKVWWSERLNVLRVEEINDTDSVSFITDYNANISYAINKLGTECHVGSPNQEKPSIVSLLIGSKKEDIKGIQKVGKRRCELSECEIWTGETVSGESFDIYLYSQNSPEESGFVPAFVDLFRKNKVLELYSRRKFINYVPALGEWSALDVTPCFTSNIRNIPFELTITGEINEKWRFPSFRETIYSTIWNSSRLISPLRLQDFQIIPQTNETIIVKGMIVDVYSMKIDCRFSGKDISSEEALENIRAMTRKDVFTDHEGYQLRVSDFKVKKDTPKPGGKKYGPGDMGGLAVGMILVGMILGVFLVLFIMRKKMKRK